MNLFGLSGLLTGITSLAMGLFVLSKNPANKLNRIWFSFTTSIAAWGFFVLWIAVEQNPGRALIAWRLAYACGVIWIPVLFYHFVLIFCERPGGRSLPFHYLIGGLFSLLTLFTPLINSGVRYVFSSFYYNQPGSLYPIYFTWWIGLVLYAHYLVYKSYTHALDIRRNQFKYFFIGFFVSYGTGALAYLPVFGIDAYPYGTFGILLYPFIMTYAIVAYRAMDITTIIHKTAMWLVISSLIVFPVGGAYLFSRKWLEGLSSPMGAVTVGILTLLSIPYVRIVQSRIDQLFQRRKYDMQAVLRQLLNELAVLKEVPVLIRKMTRTIRNELYISNITVLLWSPLEQDFYIMQEDSASKKVLHLDSRFTAWLVQQDRIVPWEEITSGPVLAVAPLMDTPPLNRFEVKYVLPFAHNEKLIGLMYFGEKANLKAYSDIDLEFLSMLRAEVSIALSNSIMYDDLKRISEALGQSEQSLKESVKTLNRSNQDLRQFSYVVAHDLREPLRTMVSSVEFLFKHYHGKFEKEADEFMQYAIDSGVRMNSLITDLLKYSKLTMGSAPVLSVESSSAIQSSLFNLNAAIRDSGAKIVSEGSLPRVMVNPIHLIQLFQNLVANAIKFRRETPLEIHISAEPIFDSESSALVWRFCVRDNGIGIAPEFFQEIFVVFHQLHPHSEYSGTGVGLAICKKIVESYKGRIWVESVVGEGSAFYFILPVTLQASDKEKAGLAA
jgi:signal transduction histidine kinase